MLYDSNGFKPYIFFVFHNLSMYHTHIYSIGPTLKSVGYRVFGRFLKFSKLLRQFSPNMSSLWPRHIRLAGHVRLLARTCPGLRFPSYIKGVRRLSSPKAIWASSTKTPRFLGDLTPFLLRIFKS
jgi:hypothetical protein